VLDEEEEEEGHEVTRYTYSVTAHLEGGAGDEAARRDRTTDAIFEALLAAGVGDPDIGGSLARGDFAISFDVEAKSKPAARRRGDLILDRVLAKVGFDMGQAVGVSRRTAGRLLTPA
jgi:hypothetical protein